MLGEDAHFDRMLDEHLKEPPYCEDCQRYEEDCLCEISLTNRIEDDRIEALISARENRIEAEADQRNWEYDRYEP